MSRGVVNDRPHVVNRPGTAWRPKFRLHIRRSCGRSKIFRSRRRSGSPFRPAIRVGVEVVTALVAPRVGREICQVHVVVAVRQQRVPQRREDAGLVLAEMTGEDQVQRRSGLRLVFVVPRGCTSPGSPPLGRPSDRTGKSSPRRLLRPSRWSRRRVSRASGRRSS